MELTHHLCVVILAPQGTIIITLSFFGCLTLDKICIGYAWVIEWWGIPGYPPQTNLHAWLTTYEMAKSIISVLQHNIYFLNISLTFILPSFVFQNIPRIICGQLTSRSETISNDVFTCNASGILSIMFLCLAFYTNTVCVLKIN